MTAYNVVRFRVKPGREQDFVDAHKIDDPGFEGMRKFALIDTGGGTYCVVGEWESFDHLVDAGDRIRVAHADDAVHQPIRHDARHIEVVEALDLEARLHDFVAQGALGVPAEVT